MKKSEKTSEQSGTSGKPRSERTHPRISIRPMKEHELSGAVEAVREIPLLRRYRISRDRLFETLLQGIQSPDRLLSAAWVGEPGKEHFAGFALFASRGTFLMGGYLKLLVTAPGFEGLGIGRSLLAAMEDLVKKESREMFLLVSDFNIPAQRFYERNGYRKAGALPGLVLKDVSEYLYWKRLKPGNK